MSIVGVVVLVVVVVGVVVLVILEADDYNDALPLVIMFVGQWW